MAYDISERMIQASASGWSAGAAAGANILRMQQLRSEQAMRQLQERQLAQQLAMQVEKHDLAVQERADMSKAMARVEADMLSQQLPTQMATGVSLRSQSGGAIDPYQAAAQPNMQANLAQSLVKNVMPVLGKYRPGEVDNFLANVALMEQRQKAQMEPEMKVITDPVTGQKRSMARTGANSWQLVQPDVGQRQQAAFSRAEMGKMVDWVRKERPDLLGQLQRDASGNLQVPDHIIGEAAKQAGITTKTRTDLEATEIGAENVFELGKRLLPLINERTTGAKAEAKRFLQRTGITTLIPALDDPEISVAEAVGRTFTAGFVKAMRSDGNIGIMEREELERAAETINWTTEASGKSKLASIVKDAANKSRRAAQRKGTPVNPLFLTQAEIEARISSGDITPKEAAALYSNTAENFLNTIEQDIK